MKLQVEQVGDPKHLVGTSTKTGKPYDFYSYSFKSGANWYQVNGKGGENLQQGQTVNGTIEKTTYTKADGSKGENNKFTFIDPIIGELLERVDKLEKFCYEGKQEPVTVSNNDIDEDLINSIPF